MALERLRRPGRSPAAARRGSSGGPRGSRAGRRRSPATPRPAAAGARRARRRGPRRRWRRCRGRRRAPGWWRRRARAASARTASGSAAGAAGHLALDRVPGVAVVDLDVPVVHRHRDEDGAARRQAGEVDAVRERQRHVLGPRRLVAPLDERVRHPRRVAVGQVGLQRDLRPHLLAGGDQQRRVVGLGVEDRAHRVADARARCGG